MPKRSDRQRLLDDLEEVMKCESMLYLLNEVFESDSESESDDDFSPYSLLHFLVNQHRYLNHRAYIAKSKDYVYNYFWDQRDDEFRKITRVTRDTFRHIMSLIEHHPVFHNRSIFQQAPIQWQLACALDRLGNDGQGVSHARSKLIWGIGQGTVHLYTRRVIRALCSLQHVYIQWPDIQARQCTSDRMTSKGFKGVVGFVDGTTFPLHKKPVIHGHLFMDRKHRYSINAQVVCDDRRQIIYFFTGFPGRAADHRVYMETPLYKEPTSAFSPGEYLLADSAYATSEYLVPSYKGNQRDDRHDNGEPEKIERFNTFLAKARVVNEHTIGVLKARWTSLRGLRVDIHKLEDMRSTIEQITTIFVLHNICNGKDEWDEEINVGDEVEVGEDEFVVPPNRRALTAGQVKRWQVRCACLAYHEEGIME